MTLTVTCWFFRKYIWSFTDPLYKSHINPNMLIFFNKHLFILYWSFIQSYINPNMLIFFKIHLSSFTDSLCSHIDPQNVDFWVTLSIHIYDHLGEYKVSLDDIYPPGWCKWVFKKKKNSHNAHIVQFICNIYGHILKYQCTTSLVHIIRMEYLTI